MGARHPPFPTPPASIGYRLIEILPDLFQIRSTEPVPRPYLGNCSGKFVWRAVKDFFGGGGRIESLPLSVSISLAIA
jgi:hypothetical protein